MNGGIVAVAIERHSQRHEVFAIEARARTMTALRAYPRTSNPVDAFQ